MRINKKVVPLAFLLSLGALFLFSSFAQGAVITRSSVYQSTATLSANPTFCVFNSSGTCSITLSWSSTGGTGYVQLWRLTPGGVAQFYVGEGGGAGNAACTPIGASGTLARSVDTNYPIRRFALYPASDCTSAGANTSEKLDEITVSGDTRVHSPEEHSQIKGMFFQPETYTQNGTPTGNRWIFHYFTPGIREQAKAEMRAIKQRTGATHLVIPASAFSHLSWPTPTEDELDRVSAIINDANEIGFKVILGMGHPYIVPRSHLQSGVSPTPVCGHNTGDVVNGYTLFWDIPECPENNIALSKEWYRAAITGIERRLNDRQGIAYIQLSGNMGLPFYTEMGMFHDGHPYLNDAQVYIGAMVPYLHSITNIPIGALLLSYNLDPAGQNNPERFLPNVFAAVPLEQWDYLDIAWSPHVRMNYISGMDNVLATASRKLILGDGKANLMTSMTQAQVIKYHFDLVRQDQLGGFWYWTYKDQPNNPAFIGLRQYGYAGENPGGWKQDAVNAFGGVAPSGTGGGDNGGTGSGGTGGSGSSGSSGGTSGGVTTASLQAQIVSLLAQIAALQAQLGISPSTGAFFRDLMIGSQGEDVRSLQTYLNTHGAIVSTFGPGSRGSETATFGPATRAALIRFQAANNIFPASGYLGPKTRAYATAHP